MSSSGTCWNWSFWIVDKALVDYFWRWFWLWSGIVLCFYSVYSYLGFTWFAFAVNNAMSMATCVIVFSLWQRHGQSGPHATKQTFFKSGMAFSLRSTLDFFFFLGFRERRKNAKAPLGSVLLGWGGMLQTWTVSWGFSLFEFLYGRTPQYCLGI